MLAFFAGLAGWATIPFTYNPGPGASLMSAEHAASPWTVLLATARFLDSRPELSLQIVLFAFFSLPLYTPFGGSRERRMWGVVTYLSLLFLAFVLLPILALGVPVELGPFLVAYGPCAIIAFLVTFLMPSERAGTL